MNKRMLVLIAFTIVIFSVGCVKNEPPASQNRIFDGPDFQAKFKCAELCKEKLNERQDISNGPCLSNEIAPDWVCDVAHSPRQTIDNLPENQCSAYREGKMHHFVEVDEKCNLIRAV